MSRKYNLISCGKDRTQRLWGYEVGKRCNIPGVKMRPAILNFLPYSVFHDMRWIIQPCFENFYDVPISKVQSEYHCMKKCNSYSLQWIKYTANIKSVTNMIFMAVLMRWRLYSLFKKNIRISQHLDCCKYHVCYIFVACWTELNLLGEKGSKPGEGANITVLIPDLTVGQHLFKATHWYW